ncbi:LPXTG cell wall anchor domain-containing protein [Ferruginibacter sp.]|nr:LPXTG cell wall anchor domain-containing protein [Ferruginibacter sp.]
MYKKIVTLIVAFVYCVCVFADTPGKAAMHDSKISFQGIKNIGGYTFYWSMERGDSADAVITDSSFNMAASNGAPYFYSFWGINNITKKSTDTIPFHNYYSPDYVVILNAVKNDSINYTQLELSNANDIVHEGNTDSIFNKQLVADAKAAKRKHYVKVVLFYLAGIAGLAGLTWFFVRRRKKKATVL